MPPLPTETIRIANGAGFWGDNLDAPIRLIESGQIDVLTLEYLAELTLAILSHLRTKDPRLGYVGDFPDLLERAVPHLRDGHPFSIATNAGGLNPSSCAERCGAILEANGLGDTPIGVVTGDDLISRIPALLRDGRTFDHLETGEPIGAITDRLVSANAYLGGWPIAEALAGGSRIVLTGRVADASLTLGPAAHHFGLAKDDWPALAGVTVAGHLIECGAQATGGLWHRWNEVNDLDAVGYPIAEIDRNGTSVITKPDGSGGLVSVANVAEQLVYEIDDPSCYRTPDVDVDLTSVRLTQSGINRVRVTESTGQAPSDFYKVAAVYRDGWSASGMLAVVGRDAETKARAAGRMVLDRVKLAGFGLADSLVECLGAGDVAPGLLRPIESPREVVLRVTVRDPRREAVARFCRELAPLITSGPPGLAGYALGRPEARPAFGYWPCLIPKSDITARIDVRAANEWRSR